MITQKIYIEKYDWTVWAYYAVDCYYVDDIVKQLVSLGCSGDFLQKAIDNMTSCTLNQGLTYTNLNTQESVIVISLTSSAAQFVNSLTHELFHLVSHISEKHHIECNTEEAAYLMGDTAELIYNKVQSLLCPHCREEI